MAVRVLLGETGENTFEDVDSADGSGERYAYQLGEGGALIIMKTLRRAEGRPVQQIDRVYGPSSWHSVTGDVQTAAGALLA